MRWIRTLLCAAAVMLFAGCVIIFIIGASPSNWAVAMKIRCTELEVLGADDTPTTITETDGVIVVEGPFWAEGAITSGLDDSVKGGLVMAGPATGQFGPSLMLYLSGDQDDTIDYFHMRPSTDNLFLGPNLDPDAFTMENDGTVDLTAGFKLKGTAITSTAAELNFNDGSVAGTAVASKTLVLGSEKNVDELQVDGILDVGGNVIAGAVSTTENIQAGDSLIAMNDLYLVGGDLLVGDPSTTISQAELKLLDGAIAGTAVASKALVLGADKNIDTLDITKDGLEIGGSAVTITAAEANYLDTSTPGTAVASKALVLGANKNVDTIVVADSGFKLGAGAGTAVTSTAAELNLLDGSVAGTAVASKAAVLGASKDLDYLAITGGAGADLEVAGEIFCEGMFYPISGYTTNQDIGTTHTYVMGTTTGGSVTFTLPDRSSANNGRVYFFKKDNAANTLTIDGNGGDTIDGAASFSATADNAYLQIIGSDTDGWAIIGNKDFS